MKHNTLNQEQQYESHQQQINNDRLNNDGKHQGRFIDQKQQKYDREMKNTNKDEARDFFSDKSQKKVQNNKRVINKPTQGPMFRRTYSIQLQQQIPQNQDQNKPQQPNPYYLQENQVIQQMHPVLKSPSSSNIQNTPINKYQKHLDSANHYLKLLRLSNYLSLFRFLFIVFVYYNLQYTIPRSTINPILANKTQNIDQSFNNTQADSSVNYQTVSSKPNNLYDPWNIMVYFLSGSIDLIAIIGYVTSIRTIKLDIKILTQKYNIQNAMLQNNQGPLMLTRALKIGKQSVYTSVYSTLNAYRFKNRDQAAPYKISKIMHIFATFLFFGRMALVQQYNYEQQYHQIFGAKQVCLWLFLLFAYLASFQVDFFGIESSTGPWIKVQKFSWIKIKQVYSQFWKWRKKYTRFIKMSLICIPLCIISDVVIQAGVLQQQIFSMLTILKAPLLIIAVCIVSNQKQLSIKTHQYLKSGLKSETIFPNSGLYTHKNLAFLGIISKHASKVNYLVICLWRIFVFLYGISILRVSDINGYFMIIYFINVALFSYLFLVQLWKFKIISKNKIILLDTCKFSQLIKPAQLNSSVQVKSDQISLSQPATMNKRNKNNKQVQSSCLQCSVCLLEYSPEQSVIVVSCGHIFHEQCLIDWTKQKKQCPLCRYNLDDYFQQTSF